MIRLEDGVKSEGKEKSVLLIAFQCCLIRLSVLRVGNVLFNKQKHK
ncbi:hypothetical protein VCRA2123E76_20266 [Vibrio crassostreae]|nr:hypothetical protein VCRA2123E76_20266 [Vibrio crassostreae]